MQLREQVHQWYVEHEHQKIVDAVLKLPEAARTDELLGQLAVAYNNLEEYENAITILEQLQAKQEDTPQWQYRMGYARYYQAVDGFTENEAQKETQLREAKQAFSRCLFLNPSQEIEEDCRDYLKWIEEELHEIVNQAPTREKQSDTESALEVYTEAEMEVMEQHIAQYFGDFDNVFHEIISPDIHVDICVISPSKERNYYTLVTMGMGAHKMAVPAELAEYKLEHAELAICLPAEWKIGDDDEIWYWPIRLLKSLARLPGNCDSWLGWGHTVDNQESYAEHTELSGTLLVSAQTILPGGDVCVLPNGIEVNFYQVIPLYQEEVAFKQEHDAETLLDHMEDISFVVDPKRPNVCIDLEWIDTETDYAESALDWAELHLDSIREKQLPVDELTAYQHLAIYLRWCIEQDLMSEQFLAEYPQTVQDVKQGQNCFDLRLFLKNELDGWLIYPYFNEAGIAFAQYYYSGDDDDAPYYPADVDDYALYYFGAERYHSEEFQDEAYLFVPYEEAYYQGMKQYLDHHYTQWCLRQNIH